MLGRPHLMLTDFSRDEGLLIFGQLIQPLDRILRLDHFFVVLVTETLPRLPCMDLTPPGRKLLPVRFQPARPPALQQSIRGKPRIGDDRQVDRDVLVDRGGINVDVDFFRLG